MSSFPLPTHFSCSTPFSPFLCGIWGFSLTVITCPNLQGFTLNEFHWLNTDSVQIIKLCVLQFGHKVLLSAHMWFTQSDSLTGTRATTVTGCARVKSCLGILTSYCIYQLTLKKVVLKHYRKKALDTFNSLCVNFDTMSTRKTKITHIL